MTLISLASKLAIKNRCEEIKTDIRIWTDMSKMAKKLVSEMAIKDIHSQIQVQVKYLKNKRKEIVKNFEKGAIFTYKNDEGDSYKCELVFETEAFVEVMYWVPYLEEFQLTKIATENISDFVFPCK